MMPNRVPLAESIGGNEMLDRSALDGRRPGGTRHVLTGLTSWIVILVAAFCLVRFPRSWLIVAAVFLGLFLLRAIVVLVYAILSDGTCRTWDRADWAEDEDSPRHGGLSPADVRHVVLVPNYKEPVSLLRRTLDALAGQHRASERLIVVLGMEERELDAAIKGELLAHEYEGRFLDVMVTVHPAGLPGEVPGKSSNQAWALKEVTRRIGELSIDPDRVTITSCDADSVMHRHYFAALSRLFAEAEYRHLRFWQAPMQYFNNIWRVPAPIRFSTWFGQAWMRANLLMPFYASFPISTYSLSLRLAVDSGGWDPGVIPEDWHMFLQCFFASGERVQLSPIFLPTNADAPEGDTWISGMKTAFQQCVRHSWGAEDVGFVVREMRQRGFGWRAVVRFGQVYSDHVLRAVGWFLVVGAYLLAAGMHPEYQGILNGTVFDIGRRAAVLGPIFSIGAVVMIGTLLFEMNRQSIPREIPRLRVLAEQVLMWMCLPVLGFYLGMLPTMQAQTMLLLGLPLTYKVTPKRVAASQDATALAAQQRASEI